MKLRQLIEHILESTPDLLDPNQINALVKACWLHDDLIPCGSIIRVAQLIRNNPNSRFFREEYHDRAMKGEARVRNNLMNNPKDPFGESEWKPYLDKLTILKDPVTEAYRTEDAMDKLFD